MISCDLPDRQLDGRPPVKQSRNHRQRALSRDELATAMEEKDYSGNDGCVHDPIQYVLSEERYHLARLLGHDTCPTSGRCWQAPAAHDDTMANSSPDSWTMRSYQPMVRLLALAACS